MHSYPPKFDPDLLAQASALSGPILVLGAGGFIGVNLLAALGSCRKDVYGVSQTPKTNWRLMAGCVPPGQLLSCDITDCSQLGSLLAKVRPKTVFNLAAYGAYSRQAEYKKIYLTNFNAAIDAIELLKPCRLAAYVHAGSSSEYGLNSDRPDEHAELKPNSHYAVSKAAASYALGYYGGIENLPVVNLRLYSAYGPWEEPDRLIPRLISCCRNGLFPPLVDPGISRDFIYIDDVISAFIGAAAAAGSLAGQSLNIGTGKKTTIRELALLAQTLCQVPGAPLFGTMDNRNWDRPDWCSSPRQAEEKMGWKAKVSLEEGLRRVIGWQQEVNFDQAFWNSARTQ